MSIRFKLTIMFLFISVIPLVIISIMTFNNYKSSLEQTRISELRYIAAYKADRIEYYFHNLKAGIKIAQTLYNIKWNLPVLTKYDNDRNNPAYARAVKTLDGQLINMQNVMELSDIILINPGGDIAYLSSPSNFSNSLEEIINPSEMNVLKNDRERVFFSDIFLNRATGSRPSMVIAVPVYDFGNKYIGIIAYLLDMKYIYNLIQDVTGLGKTGETLVAKEFGNRVVFLNPLRQDPNAALKRYVLMGDRPGAPVQEAVRGKTGTGILPDYQGDMVIASWRYIPVINWGMVAKIDVSEAFSQVEKLKNLAMMIFMIIFALCAVLVFFMARSISEPIKRLSNGAEIIGKGSLDHKVGIGTKDEIGKLSRAFDKMTSDLKKITASRDELDNEITERKKAEQALKRSNENLEQFAYVASHDLQEPLRMMASFSELLERRYKNRLDSDADEFIGFIVDGAKRMQKLINDLLAYSRIGRPGTAYQDIDCNNTLAKVISSMINSIEEKGAVITNDELPVLPGIESEFIQLFQNLIGNAVKFHGNDSPRVHISAERQPGHWLFSVKDNGIGIESQYKDKIFLIFQRLHARGEYPGTGIGLSICKKIIESRGGRIWVESESGKGSVFYFTIPIKGEDENEQ